MRFFNVSFRCPFVNNISDETRNPDLSNTKTYGSACDASLPIRTRDFTGSSLCHVIKQVNIGYTSEMCTPKKQITPLLFYIFKQCH